MTLLKARTFLSHIVQKENITIEITTKIARVNWPLEYTIISLIIFHVMFLNYSNQCSSVMNLFDISQNFLTSGPTWLSQSTRPQSARTAGLKKDKIKNLSSVRERERQEPQTKIKSE